MSGAHRACIGHSEHVSRPSSPIRAPHRWQGSLSGMVRPLGGDLGPMSPYEHVLGCSELAALLVLVKNQKNGGIMQFSSFKEPLAKVAVTLEG